MQDFGNLQEDTPLRVCDLYKQAGRCLLKVAWKPRSTDGIQREPTVLSYDVVKARHPEIIKDYLMATFEAQLQKSQPTNTH